MPIEEIKQTAVCNTIKNNAVFDDIKKSIDLADYVRSCGISLSKHGSKDLKGLCPFHNDKNPSLIISPGKNLFNCPVCQTGGSVIDFASKIKNLTIPQTIKELSVCCNRSGDNKPIREDQCKSVVSPERTNELLEKSISFYEKTFINNLSAKSYLESRSITDAGLFSKHRIGCADGSLLKALPSEGKILDDLETLGILVKIKTGYVERFNNCVVFPVFDTEGGFTTLYGRCVADNGSFKHVYLPNRPTGMFNIAVCRTYPKLVLVESVIDALSLEMCGVHNVISIQGTNGLSESDIKLFIEHGVTDITLLLDGDTPGRNAALKLATRLSDHFKTTMFQLPEKEDPNSYLSNHGVNELTSFLANEPKAPAKQEKNLCASVPPCENKNSLVVQYGLRKYEIIGLERKARSLKATVRVEKSGRIHVDTIDFYSSRMRRQLSQDICNTFEELPDTVNADIAKLLVLCESHKQSETDNKKDVEEDKEPKAPVLAPAERKEAEEFGKSPELIENILTDYEKCGLIGEETNKLLCYLAMTSRKMTEPLSILILSSSGAGKTALQDGALAFCPPEDLVKLTSLSGKALFYKERTSLKNKILAIEEGAGAEDASYAIRNLISSDGLTSEATVRDPSTGKLTTMSNHVEGPTAVFCTTTDPEVDAETKSRFLVTGIDESPEQTKRILEFQRKRHSLEGVKDKEQIDKVLRVQRNFQRLLKPCKIVNPYINELNYDDCRLQSRRVQPQYLSLINAVAFLGQLRREAQTDIIEVEKKDIELANKIAVEILGKTLDELSIPSRNLLELLEKMIDERISKLKQCDSDRLIKRSDITFTRRDIREFTSWTQTRLRNHLKELIDLEYIVIDSGGNGRSLQNYKLMYDGQGKDGNKFLNGLKSELNQV